MKRPFKSATFNPLDFIDKDSPTAIDDCRDIAQALVLRTGQEKDPHWCDGAEIWIASMIGATVEHGGPDNRSLQTVRDILTNPQRMKKAIEIMQQSGGMLARMGHQLTNFQGDELGSTLTTTNRFLRFLDTPAIAETTRASSFDPAGLRQDRMTVYLVLPPEHMRAQSPWLRMNIGALLRACVRGGLDETRKVHFVLDEAVSLGHMEAIDDALDKYRAYGVRLQFYFQSVGQLKKCFPDGQDQTLLSNTTQMFFGVNDIGENKGTADYISARVGDATVLVQSGGTSRGSSKSYSEGRDHNVNRGTSWNENANWNQQARRLLKPEEVLALPPRTAITFTPGFPPVRTTLLRFFEEKWLTRRRTWFGRQWEAFSVLMRSLVFLAWMLAMAVLVTQLAGEAKLPERIGQFVQSLTKGGSR